MAAVRYTRNAYFYPRSMRLTYWSSPSGIEDRECKSLQDAEELVRKSGVLQKLEKAFEFRRSA